MVLTLFMSSITAEPQSLAGDVRGQSSSHRMLSASWLVLTRGRFCAIFGHPPCFGGRRNRKAALREVSTQHYFLVLGGDIFVAASGFILRLSLCALIKISLDCKWKLLLLLLLALL
jgi:hypothetical protein